MPDRTLPRVIAAMSPGDRASLLARSVHRSLRPGQPLYLAGDRSDRVFGLRSGVIKLLARNAEGAETILGLSVPGDLVGEVAALDDLPQPTDAVACTRCEVLSISAAEFVAALDGNPAAALETAAALAARLRWSGECALERSSVTVPARLAGRLLDLADLMGRVEGRGIALDLPVAQGDLGRLAGMCRESACKTLRRFQSQGIVEYRGRNLRILRPDVLERIRCAGRA